MLEKRLSQSAEALALLLISAAYAYSVARFSGVL